MYLVRDIPCKKAMEYRNDEKWLNCKGESLLIPGASENLTAEVLSNRTQNLH